ncbi:Uncharacterized protein APZ42_005284 [Daphnia magna]|uniref:Uncharacterized protein n=1 Tax=Daphnia magna TaxID=35525 RepID=A0A164GJB0_9CRUS|nr:Uncharacterized protein APZ42_005284 [Daphnia magna]
MVRTMKDLLRRSNDRACSENDELEVCLIETENVVNARPLTYVAEGSEDPLPIIPNQFLNNRRSNCTPPEPAENLMAPNATNLKLLEMDRQQLCEDQPVDVEIPPTPELELEPEEATPPVAATDPVEQEEPWTTGSGGECVGNIPRSQHSTTRVGRRTRLPSRFNLYDLGGPR